MPDSQVDKMLHFFTFLSVGHIKDLMEAHQREPEKRKAQTKLAEQVFNLKRNNYPSVSSFNNELCSCSLSCSVQIFNSIQNLVAWIQLENKILIPVDASGPRQARSGLGHEDDEHPLQRWRRHWHPRPHVQVCSTCSTSTSGFFLFTVTNLNLLSIDFYILNSLLNDLQIVKT